MRGEDFDHQISMTFSALSSYSGSVIGHARALAREGVVSVALTASLILLGAAIMLIAVLFFMFGAAKGLGVVLGVDIWIGFLMTGTVFFLSTLLLFIFIIFMGRKKILKKRIEQKEAAEMLACRISEITDVRSWVQEHPLCSTGAAAAAGFTLSGAIMPNASYKGNALESPSESCATGQQGFLVGMVLAVAGDILKEVVVPMLREQFSPDVPK